MPAAPLPVEPLRSEPDRFEALADVFETERRLLDELRRILLRQRDGLASNDVEQLDESVYSAQRIFLTLQQARMRRRTLLRLVAGQEELPLRELEDAVGPDVPEELIAARDRLLESAHVLDRELRVNRQVISGAMSVGDEIIRAMAGAQERGVYTAEAKERQAGEAGALVNKRA